MPRGGWELWLDAKGTPSSARLIVTDGLASLSLDATEQTREVFDRENKEWNKKFKAAKTKEEAAKLFWGRKTDVVTAGLSAYSKGTSFLTLKHGLGGGFDFHLLRRQPTLSLMDEKGTTRVALGHTTIEFPATGVMEERPPSSLVLFKKDGKVIWQAP